MGNTNSNTGSSNGKQRISRRASTETGKAALAGNSTNAGGMSRSASGTDINEKNYTQFVPVDKLAKVNLNFIFDLNYLRSIQKKY